MAGRNAKRNRRIAAAEAKVRYDPQTSAVRDLMQTAIKDYATDVSTNKNEAKQVIRGAKKAVAPTRALYSTAQTSLDSAYKEAAGVLSGLGRAGDIYKAATARDQATQTATTAASQANALNALKETKQRARAGRQYGQREARSTYRSTMQKLGQQLIQLGDQKGAYQAGRLSQLGADAADRRWERKKLNLENAQDLKVEGVKQSNREKQALLEDSLEDKSKGGGGGSGGSGGGGRTSGGATHSESAGAQKLIAKAMNAARAAKAGRVDFSRALNALVQGQEGIKPKAKYNPDGSKKLNSRGSQKMTRGVPAIAAFDDPVLAKAAMEQVYNGHVSTPTIKLLNRRGFKAKDLGLTSPKSYGKANPKKYGPF